jgi:hypothetical protein
MRKELKFSDVPVEGRPYNKVITLMGKCLKAGGDVDFKHYMKMIRHSGASDPKPQQVIDVVMRWPS